MKLDNTTMDRAGALRWFHAIDFGDFQSGGRYKPDDPPNASLYGVMDLLSHIDFAGLDCLDIGTVDGLAAFHMKSRGASRVVATDMTASPRETFELARETLRMDIEFSGDTEMVNIVERLGEHQFDVVLCSGVMYHMLNPFDAVLQCRRLLKNGGILILQTVHLPKEPAAIMKFNPIENVNANINTFWIPSVSAIEGMLALGGFETLASREIDRPKFAAVAAVNRPLDQLHNAPEMIRQMHAGGIRPREFVRDLPAEKSTASYSGKPGHMMIRTREFDISFWPSPQQMTKPVGSSHHKR